MIRNGLAFLAALFALLPGIVHASVALNQFTVTTSVSAISDLFLTIGNQSTPGSGSDEGASVTWPVTVNIPLLSTQPNTVVVNFPDRAAASLSRDRGESQGSSTSIWTGRGDGCSAVFVSYKSGFLGTISCLNAPYRIAAQGNSTLQLTRYDQTSGMIADNGTSNLSSLEARGISTPPAQSQLALADSVIEILVLYTEGVRATLDPGGGNTNSQAFALEAVARTQMALSNSTQIGHPLIAQVSMVHATKVAHSESGDLPTELFYLRTDPEPTGLRDYWGADVVIMVTSTGAATECGTSNEPGTNGFPVPGPTFAPFAQAVLKKQCDIANFAFQHEFGHVLGANHNPGSQNNPAPLEPYAWGHFANREMIGTRTIMALKTSSCLGSCPDILNYSNANVTVGDFVTGIANQRENARVIEEFAPATAQYRASLGRIFSDRFEEVE